MNVQTLRFSSLFVINFGMLAILMYGISHNAVILGTQLQNPLIGAIPILAGICVFYLFDNFSKMIKTMDAVGENEIEYLFSFCSKRSISAFVLTALVLCIPLFLA